MYIIFDTETNGKPADYKLTVGEILKRSEGDRDTALHMLKNWPRIIQMAWIVAGPDKQVKSETCALIKPDGWEIPKEKFWIDNGYSTVVNEAKGLPLVDVLGLFIENAADCTVMVAHNMAFDYNVIAAEMIRYQLRAKKRLEQYCTMENGAAITKLPGYKGQYKWPSLTELHTCLTGNGFAGAHDAMNDVRACADCFFEMMKRS